MVGDNFLDCLTKCVWLDRPLEGTAAKLATRRSVSVNWVALVRVCPTQFLVLEVGRGLGGWGFGLDFSTTNSVSLTKNCRNVESFPNATPLGKF